MRRLSLNLRIHQLLLLRLETSLDKARNQPFDYLEDTPPGWVDRLLVESISFDGNSSNLDVAEQQQVFKVWRLIIDMINHY